jgi:uncharacterized membrane protein
MPESTQQRFAYIDWMRGLACLLMFQDHCYDSWLGGHARNTSFIKWSELGGTFPAPLFLFLAGISFALVTDRMRSKGVSGNEIAATTIRRGAEIFAFGLLFRLQEYLLGLPWAPWTDLLRVDVLNTIGISMMLMGLVCRPARTRLANTILAAAAALGISMATPPLWTTWRPHWLPWYLESYVNGVHNLGVPQAWLFPIFPWTAFAFAGLAMGFLIFSDWAKKNLAKTTVLCGAGGAGLFYLSEWIDGRPWTFYSVYDYWHTSPEFFLARVGILLMIIFLSYAWCRWGAGQWGFSPIIALGQNSLVAYWVHIEFVYGRFSIMTKRAQTIPMASLGLLVIFVAMVFLSVAKSRWKGSGSQILAWFRRNPSAAG